MRLGSTKCLVLSRRRFTCRLIITCVIKTVLFWTTVLAGSVVVTNTVLFDVTGSRVLEKEGC